MPIGDRTTCAQCGLESPAGSLFCARCGSSLQPLGAAAARAGGGAEPAPPRRGLARAAAVAGAASVLLLPCGVGIVTGLAAALLGIVALVKANQQPARYGGRGAAIAGLVSGGLCVLAAPVLLAIAVPALLRARIVANEQAALRDVRSVLAAQAAYAAHNGDYYDRLECLVEPRSCIPGFPEAGPAFLDPALASASERQGYLRRLQTGPAPQDADPARVSPTSVVRFAYVAAPSRRGRTGLRSFCGDDTGRICASAGALPEVDGGRCPAGCATVE